jgi:hypothetical protein
MKMTVQSVFLTLWALTAVAEESTTGYTREFIRAIHQDILKWDENGDGKLTCAERDAFLAAKRKEIADAAAAGQAAKSNPPKPQKPRLPKPTLGAENAADHSTALEESAVC